MKTGKHIFCALALLAAAACSTTRALSPDELLLRKATVQVNDKSFNANSLNSYVLQKPNAYILGVNPFLYVYNWAGDGQSGLQRLFRRLGTEPVVFNPSKVEESVTAMRNHLRYMGYYGSTVESDVQVKDRKVYVFYYVTPGKRYRISAIDYDIPTYGTFPQDFEDYLPSTSLKKGLYLSEQVLSAEAEQAAQFFRNRGYFGFNKGFFAFEADTLQSDGTARLKMDIRDYALGDDPASAQPHRKYRIGEVSIAYPKDLKIRHSVLENLNMLRPGQPYSEKAINDTYTRLTSVGMLSSVNINLEPVADDRVDARINLRNSGLQGFKTNLEASVNSTGLIGLSPQLTYYHKNLFHGGELLNLGLKGNFQFKPGDNASSTEVSVSTTLRFPKFIGLPNRLFKGPNIPRTEISLAFNYQNRPEYRRTVISSAFTYSGRLTERLFYQVSPVRANISRIFNISEDFYIRSMANNIFLMQLYTNNFDMGVSGMLYYTTDASAVPRKSFHYVRLGVDVSGNVMSLFNKYMPVNDYGQHMIWNTPYAQYVRAELTLGRTFHFGNILHQSLALRFLAGAGYGYGNSTSVPLDKLFYCGGSTSMRGWQARTLGPGANTLLSDIFVIPAQLGDMKIEANAEYRFPLAWKLEGALFMDAGNIWDFPVRSEDLTELSAESTFSLKTIAMDWGLGLRLNLDFILLRLDAGIRIHDPGLPEGKRWVAPANWLDKGNAAIHFGVGYPF